MAEFKFDFAFQDTAKEDYLALNEADQATIDGLIGFLRVDPFIDPENHKYRYPVTAFPLIVYDDDYWSVVYQIMDDSVVELWAIERSDPNWPASTYQTLI